MLISKSKVNTAMGETGYQQGMTQRQEEEGREGRHEKERKIRRDRKRKSRKERRPIKA